MRPGFSGTSLDVVGLVVRWVVQVSGLFDEKHFCSGYRMDSAERHGRAVRTLFDSVRCKTGMAWRRNSQFIWWPDLDGWAKNGRNLCAARRSTGKSAGKKKKRREENLVQGSRSAVKQVRVCANEHLCEVWDAPVFAWNINQKTKTWSTKEPGRRIRGWQERKRLDKADQPASETGHHGLRWDQNRFCECEDFLGGLIGVWPGFWWTSRLRCDLKGRHRRYKVGV